MKKNNIYLILVLALLLGQNGISNANSGDPMNVNTKSLEKIEVEKVDNKDLGDYCDSKPVIQKKVLNPDLEQPQKEEKEIITHTVKKGESLWKIAELYLGDGNRWRELIDLNKGDYPSLETKPNLIYVGWQIKVALDKEEKTDTDTETKTDITTKTEVATDTKVLPDDKNKPNVDIDEKNAKDEKEIVKGPVWTIEQKITKLQQAVDKMNHRLFAAGRGDFINVIDSYTVKRLIANNFLTQEDWMAMNPPIGYTYVIRNSKVILINSKNVALTSEEIAKLDKELADKYTRKNNTNTSTNTTTNTTHNSWTFTTTTTRIATDTNNVISPRPNTNTNINIKPDKPSDFIEREGRLKDTMTKTFTFTDINIDPRDPRSKLDPRDPRSKLDPITYTKTITSTNTNTNTKTKTNTNTNTNTKNNTNTKTNTNTNRDSIDPRDPRSKLGTLTYTWTYYNTNTRTNTSVATPTYVNNGSNRNTNSSVATPTYVNNNNSNSNRGDNRNTPASNFGQSLGDLFKAVQDAGKEIGQAGKELGKTVSDAGKGIAKDFKDMGQEFKKAGQDIADEVKQTGQDIANEAKQTGQDVADGVKQTGQELKRAGEDVVDGFKQVGEDFEDGFNRGSGRDGYRRHGSHGGRGRRR